MADADNSGKGGAAGKSGASSAKGKGAAPAGGGKENQPETPRGVAFEVKLVEEEAKAKAQPPSRLQEQMEKEGPNLTKEELERKLEEAEKRRSQVQEIRLDRIKDVTTSGFIGKPEVPPEDQEIKE